MTGRGIAEPAVPADGFRGFDRPVAMIGCGVMAGAILSRWLECGLRAERVMVVDPGRTAAPAAGVTLLPALPESLPARAVVVLGVKPQLLPDVAPALAPLLGAGEGGGGDRIVVSMLAGVTVERLRASLGEGAETVRIMPNMPVGLGRGVCALYADARTGDGAVETAMRLLSPLGLVERIADEGGFNLVTALTGCGPAFLFRFIDALAKGTAALGLEQEQALRFAIAMVDGAAALAKNAEETPGALADKVASKGGMTREGLDVLDDGQRLDRLILDTLRAARDRGEVLEKLSG